MIAEKSPVPVAEAPCRDFLGLVPGAVTAWTVVSGGANSRAWRVESGEGTFFLKEYYQGGEGERDRGASERAFYQVAGDRASDQVPQPLAWAPDNRAGVFRWVEGRKLMASEITADHLEQAVKFFARLNRPPLPPADVLPQAAETATSVGGHLQIVENRVRRLAKCSGEAGDFVRKEVLGLWAKIRESTRIHGTLGGVRCVSPSDFGFHNALLEKDGRLKFFDFEYGGWDDPAKMAADFLCQPRIPVPESTMGQWAVVLPNLFPKDVNLVERVHVLLPVYRIKWVCIMLNEFIPEKQKIRSFARGPVAPNENKKIPTTLYDHLRKVDRSIR
jgi:hypothetical protein